MDTLTAISSRRTIKDFTGAPVERSVLTALVTAATCAPTHRLTQPWRFYVCDQTAIQRLEAFLIATPAIAAVPDAAKGQAKLAKLRERLGSLGAMVFVTWTRATDPVIDLEDHAAASAAVQNLLLAATAMGLGSFWSTNPALGHPETLRWLGADLTAEGNLGCIWLGTAAAMPPAPPRVALADRLRFV